MVHELMGLDVCDVSSCEPSLSGPMGGFNLLVEGKPMKLVRINALLILNERRRKLDGTHSGHRRLRLGRSWMWVGEGVRIASVRLSTLLVGWAITASIPRTIIVRAIRPVVAVLV